MMTRSQHRARSQQRRLADAVTARRRQQAQAVHRAEVRARQEPWSREDVLWLLEGVRVHGVSLKEHTRATRHTQGETEPCKLYVPTVQGRFDLVLQECFPDDTMRTVSSLKGVSQGRPGSGSPAGARARTRSRARTRHVPIWFCAHSLIRTITPTRRDAACPMLLPLPTPQRPGRKCRRN